MSLATVVRSEAKLLLPTYDRQRVLFERGRGVYLWDSKGKRYLDFLSGIGVNALGHAHPVIQSTLKRQAGRLIHVSNLFFHEFQADLAKRLTKISGLDKAFFCNSGTEAWEGALKLARAFARTQNSNGHKAKWRLLALENSFHGRTFGSLATTGQEKYRHPFAPLVPGVGFVAFNDVEDLKRQFDGSVCAICLETIQGEGGIRPLSPEFLQTARQLCERTGALLILDEIQCGLGRTGKYFAYQHYGIQPDIVTVAKPLAAGLPLGALLTTDRVASGMHPGMHGTTFGGGPLACAVAIEFSARARRHAGTHTPDRRLLPRETGRPQSQARRRPRNSRHGPDAGHESRFRRSRRKPSSPSCSIAAFSSIAPRTRCCVSCRPTSFRKPTWIWWSVPSTRRSPPPNRKCI